MRQSAPLSPHPNPRRPWLAHLYHAPARGRWNGMVGGVLAVWREAAIKREPQMADGHQGATRRTGPGSPLAYSPMRPHGPGRSDRGRVAVEVRAPQRHPQFPTRPLKTAITGTVRSPKCTLTAGIRDRVGKRLFGQPVASRPRRRRWRHEPPKVARKNTGQAERFKYATTGWNECNAPHQAEISKCTPNLPERIAYIPPGGQK